MKELLLKLLLNNKPRLTADEIEVRVRAFVIVMVTLIFCFITFALLYSVTFVTQPLGQVQSENDKAFFTLLSTTVSFLVGVISGFMLNGTSAAGVTPKEESSEG